jgi:hypothetical protein
MKFGQYELLELIAVGGMAEVFKGRVVAAEGFEKLVAIKRILPDLAEDERFVKMLLTEARIHSALSHRNIVQIHDLGISEDGQYFIVLEYVEGYDLRIIIDQLAAEREIVPEVLSLHIASELAQGLHFAHELRGSDGQPMGLIHRDVTPSNVLISLAGEVKLSDFGLAKRRHDRSVVGSLKGNLSYMSPEQAQQAPLDRRTDIFSLGAVLFEMLTGRRLREITNEVAAWSQVASGVVPKVRSLRPDLPPAVEALLDRALAPDPNQRFPDAGAFGTAIRQALAQMNVPVGASDLGALLGLVKPPRRARSLMMERSKVIRLGPEARALSEAFAAPATPAPIVRAPGTTPPRATAPRVTASAAQAIAVDPDATPPPPATTPRPRGRTPLEPSPPAPSPAPRQRTRSNPPLTARAPAPASQRRTGEYPGFAPPAPQGTVPALTRTPAHGVAQPRLAGTPARGVSPYNRPQAPRATPAFGVSPAFGVQGSTFPTFAPERVSRDTARVQQLRPRGRWRGAMLFLIVVLGGGAAAVNRWVVPLDVLLVWRNPAGLSITSDPDGASLRLDGTPMAGTSPTTVMVRRDLSDHVVEATHPGYRSARMVIRYDKTLPLSVFVPLEKDPAAPADAHPASSAP